MSETGMTTTSSFMSIVPVPGIVVARAFASCVLFMVTSLLRRFRGELLDFSRHAVDNDRLSRDAARETHDIECLSHDRHSSTALARVSIGRWCRSIPRYQSTTIALVCAVH